MNIRDLLKEDSIILNQHSQTKEEAIDKLIDLHYQCGHINNKEEYKKAILARESLSSTGVGNMIAIPHAQDNSVNYPSLVAMVDKEGVDFDSLDQKPAKIFFMIAVNKDGGTQHLEILAQLSQILMDEKTVEKLLNVTTPLEFIQILTADMQEEKEQENDNYYDVVAVTACPTGIAHTYMAAKALEDTAKQLGIRIKVETNGASGVKNKLTDEDIQNAKCVIVAADKKVEMKRFSKKPIIKVPVAKGIHEAKELLEKAISGEGVKETVESTKKFSKFFKNNNPLVIIYRHFMNGISQIIPLLMIYGIFTFITIFINDKFPDLLINSQVVYEGVAPGVSLSEFVRIIVSISSIGNLFILCLLSAYIADSISDRPAFYVAFITGLTLFSMSFIESVIIGFAAGYVILLLKKLFSFLPEVIESIIPNLLLPIIGTFIMCGIYLILGFSSRYYGVAQTVPEINPILLIGGCTILGAMMSIDMGGPVNKIAYSIGIASIFYKHGEIMSAVMVAGMIPPIMIGLSMLTSSNLYQDDEVKGKWHCMIKGLCFVSEEAIPFMRKDRKGIHLPCIIASALAGGLSAYFGCSQLFPHGGIFTIFFINNPLFFVITLLSCSLIGMSLILILKKKELN